MYCSSCGKPMTAVKMQCPECRCFTPAFWLNAFSSALWPVIVTMNYFLLRIWLPPVAQRFAGVGVELPLPLRVYAGLVRLAAIAGLWLLLLAAAVLVVLRWRKVGVPNFLKSGRLLAAVTYALLVFSMLGLFSGLLCYWSLVGKLAP